MLECFAFGSVPNEVACMGFWCLYENVLGCMINKSFCRGAILDKKDDKWCDGNLVVI